VSGTGGVTAPVTAFYDELPFNYGESAESAAKLIRTRNQVAANYPDLHELLRAGPASLLDVGCGAGWLSHTCAFRYGAHTLGIDLSATAVARAQAVARELGLEDRAGFRVSDLFRRELTDSFDVVCSLGALHHTADLRGAVEIVSERVATGGSFYLGLYHSYGRAPFLELFEQYRERDLTPEEFDEAFALYAELDSRSTDETLVRSWFRDQVLHPHETQHSLREIAGLLDPLGFEVVSTSINRFEPIVDLDPLFESETAYEERARHALHVERRYVPGFFTVLARRR
jgi:SAM-dependent methyltransferase